MNPLLFYPIILSLGGIFLFLITIRIDEMFFSEEKTIIELPFVGSLLFAGSPNAARSALSTIAMGWGTILGVAFSVTLISLQLSVTKHTPERANQFENDKVNQITLGWFIATVHNS